MSSVSTPAACSAMAQRRPAGPPPITATSAVWLSLPPLMSVPAITPRKVATGERLRTTGALPNLARGRQGARVMEPKGSGTHATAPQIAAAFAVHVFTAGGAACALLALTAAVAGEWPRMFLWLGVALIIDGVDGTFARLLRVAEVLPRWSGDTLDLVVDFTTYVFVPAYAIAAGHLMPDTLAIPAAAAIAITGTLYFANRKMKTSDNFFRGFPAVWNLVAFYLLLLRPAPAIAAGMVTLFAVLTFVPVRFVHPFRVRQLRTVTVALLTLWAALALAAVKQGLAPVPWITVGLCVLGGYFLAVGLLPQPDRSE